MPKPRKYNDENLVAMFRLAADLRKQMISAGFTDNGGAIHSAERILHLLGQRICFPELAHLNNLRMLPNAPFSEAALTAYQNGQQVFIEHVNPHRALTRLAIELIESGKSDEEFRAFVRDNYQLALLTHEETTRLNRLNRTKIEKDRLGRAGIKLAAGVSPTASVTPASSQSAA